MHLINSCFKKDKNECPSWIAQDQLWNQRISQWAIKGTEAIEEYLLEFRITACNHNVYANSPST